MKKKLIILSFLLSSWVVFLPSTDLAAGGSNTAAVAGMASKPQIRVQIGGRHDRGRHNGWYKGRKISWYNYSRPQHVRQIYWVNGRRYVRWYRYS